MNLRCLFRLFRLALPVVCAALLCAPALRAVNHNPTPSSGSSTNVPKSKISIESVTATLQSSGSVEVKLKIKEEEKENGGGLATKPAIVRFFYKDGKGGETQSGSDEDGNEGANTYTISADCACKFTVRLIGLKGTEEVKADEKTDVKPTASGGTGSGGGSNQSIEVMYHLGHNLDGGGGTLFLSTNSPKLDLYSPESLTISGGVIVNRTGGVLTSLETDDGLASVEILSADAYRLKFYNKSDNSLIKTVTFANPGATPIANTTDDVLYQSARWGQDFSYNIPVPNGPLEVRLGFAELYHDAVGAGVFNVSAEGTVVLANYDVMAAAGARNTAKIEEVATMVSDGELNLRFKSTTYGAQVSTIGVVRGSVSIVGTTDDALYQSAHTGASTYQAALANGDYEVTLHFSEPVYTEAGKRVFDVKAQGVVVLNDYDIYAQAGAANSAKTETFTATVIDGHLTLDFVPVTDEPRVNAIKVKSVASGLTVAAVNAGGPSFTAGDSTVFLAETGFAGGSTDYPGKFIVAINAGGLAYTDGAGTTFQADTYFQAGRQYLGAQNRLLVTDQPSSGNPITYDYTWFTIPHTGEFGECVLSYAGGLKKEGKQQVWSADQQSYDDIRMLRDTANNLVSKVVTTYENFAFGFAKTREVIDSDGGPLTTTWTYIDGSTNPSDPKPAGYGQVKRMVRHDGYWENYGYDSNGRLSKTVSRYLDSTTESESDNKVETNTYATSNPIGTHATTIRGQEVARSYEVEIDDITNSELERQSITAVTPGAAWNAVDNLVSKTRTYKSSHPTALLQGKTKWTRQPDGTMTFFSYAQSGGDRIVTRDAGAPNPSLTGIVSGARTVTTTNSSDQTIAEDDIDIASGLTLSTWSALTVDSLGRPTLIGYGDGTTRSIAYVGSSAICGTCSGSSGNFLVDSETDRNGVTTSYAYDALNRRADTTRLGVTEHVVYDAADRVLERHRIGTDSSDIRVAKTVYDLAGQVIETYDALNNKTDYAYSYPTGGGLVSTTTYPAATSGATRGTRIETAYGDGRTKEVSGTAVSPLKYAYGTWTASGLAGEWTQEIRVGDASVETEWIKTYANLAGHTVKTEYPAPAGTVFTSMTYNALGQLEKQTDPDGVATLFAYNTKGEREVTAIDLNQNGVIDYTGTDRITKTVRDAYSKSGTIVSRTTTQVWATDNANTATTVSVSEQDGYGNQSWQTDAAGATASTAIARSVPGAWTVTVIRPDGSRQVQTYTAGRLASSATYASTSTLITQTTFGYDAHNRVSSQTDARTGAITYTYTNRDEVLTTKVNNNTETTTYAYDALGNQLTITRPDSNVTTNDYHLRNNQRKKVSGSQTYPVEYTYDLQGRMKTLTTWQNATTSAGAAVTTWNYDPARGWLTQKLYADNTGPSYTYKPSGRLLTRTWARSTSTSPLITTYGYTSSGDLASTDYSDTTPDVAVTYTRFGAQKAVTDATGTRTFTYVPSTLRPDQEQLDATFYGGRILTRSYQTTGTGQVPGRNDGFELGVTGDLDQDYNVVYGYDTAGRLSTVTDPNGSYTYGYVTNSNLRHTITGPVHVATTTYEPYRNVIDVVENKVGTTSISKYDYTVNNLGQRTQRANTGTAFGTASTDVFTYNAKGEVESATNATLTTRDQSFTYDDIGNRKTFVQNSGTTGYTANTLNQYSGILAPSSSLLTPAYDADGNQTSTGTGQSYIWDAENRLVSVEPLVPTAGDKKQLNVYDSQGRRVRKLVSTYVSGSWSLITDEKFIYDGWNLVAVLDASSPSPFALSRTYTWGTDLSGSMQGAGGVGGLLSFKDGGSVYHYTYDANGNVSEVLNSSGGIAAHYEYDAFGNTVVSNGIYATANAYRFSTKPLDVVGDLYYYGLRYYKPSTGRWPSRDPIGEWGGANAYVFINNDSVGYIDVLGLITSTEALDHYKAKTGTALRMSFDDIDTSSVKPSDFPKVKDEIKAFKKKCEDKTVKITWKSKDDNLPFSTSGDQALFLGNVSLKLTGDFVMKASDCTWKFTGTLKCFDDYYDFNASSHRSVIGEALTSIGSKIDGVPYWIEIRGSKTITQDGNLKSP